MFDRSRSWMRRVNEEYDERFVKAPLKVRETERYAYTLLGASAGLILGVTISAAPNPVTTPEFVVLLGGLAFYIAGMWGLGRAAKMMRDLFGPPKWEEELRKNHPRLAKVLL